MVNKTPAWEYCSIWSGDRKAMLIFKQRCLMIERWSPDASSNPTPLEGGLDPNIARLGMQHWEMVDYRCEIRRLGDTSRSEIYLYLLFKRMLPGGELMKTWQYCRIHHVQVKVNILSKQPPCVVEYLAPDGENIVDYVHSQNVHSVAAPLAAQGWEIVKWTPPVLQFNLADSTGDILMKRAT